MTLQEALKYDNLLKHNLMEKATTLNLSEETASQIMDQHVLVIPDDARSGMIFLGNESASYKLGNVRLNLKNAIAAGLELLAAVSIPQPFLSRNLRNRKLKKKRRTYYISYISRIAIR